MTTIDNALYARFAAASYSAWVRNQLELPLGWQPITSLFRPAKAWGFSATVFEGPSHVVVSFRGTDDLGDALINVTAAAGSMLGSSGPLAAAGLSILGPAQTIDAARLVEQAVRYAASRNKELSFTGRSLGGGLAAGGPCS